MGVMSCHRSYCENIMCSTYIQEVGYICGECQEEFEEYLKKKGFGEKLSKGEMMRQLKAFMKTDKDSFSEGEDLSVDDFFNEHTDY